MATLLPRQDIASTIANTKASFSSWDSCMSKAYCKWPVIVGIITGTLIVLSLLWCLVRCLCCGAQCCCGFLSCCNACCPSPRSRSGHQPLHSSTPAQPHYGPVSTQYKSHIPPIAYHGPQTATFDAPSKGGKVSEDALPAMPTWEQASSKKVETWEQPDEVEMEKLDAKPAYAQQGDPRSASAPMLVNAQGAPLRAPNSPPRSLRSPVQSPHYVPPARSPALPPAHEGYGYGQGQQSGYLGGDLASSGPYHSTGGSQHSNATAVPYPGYNNMPYGDDQYTGYSGTTYAPSESTRHEPSVNTNRYSYGQGQPQAQSPQGWQDQRVGRKPVQGTWRDI